MVPDSRRFWRSRNKADQGRRNCSYGKHLLRYLSGLQIAVIEYARNVAGIQDATRNSHRRPAIKSLPSWKTRRKLIRRVARCSGRLSLQADPGTLAARLYNAKEISERHRHRFEVNNAYRDQLQEHGLIIGGTSPDDKLVEMIELANHPFFIACQFHPEFKSKLFALIHV